MPRRPRLAVTLGDPCGIGPEILLRCLPRLNAWADVVVAGARAGVELLERPGRPLDWSWTSVTGGDSGAAWMLRTSEGGEALWMDPLPSLTEDLALGRGSAASGKCALEGVRAGAELVMRGGADALVTLPLNKAAVHAAGHPIPGHTEFLQALSGAPRVRMAFLSPTLNVALHTVHQSLRSVIEGLEASAVADTLAFSAERFAALTGIAAPRVALCALNPHAGEEGAFGGEEALLTDALDKARRWLPEAVFSGPHSADSLFHRAAQGDFDLVVALYHDQGLIPVKTLEPARAVNLTLGLPFLRTSPDHGTAFDRAGTWSADPTNFLHASALAVRLAGRARGEAWTAEA